MTRLLLVSLLTVAPAAVAVAAEGVGASSAPDSFTVAECVRIARATAPEVQAAAAERLAAGLDSAATARNGRPAWAISGGATVAPEWSYDPAFTNLGEYQLRLGVEMPLLDGGARRRERALAALAATQSVAERDRASREAGLRAAAVALTLLQRQEQSDFARASLVWLEHLATMIESGVRAGAQERADAMRARIEVDAVAAELSTVEEERGALTRELSQLMNRDPAQPLRVIGPDSGSAATPSAADSIEWLARADQAPEVRAARAAASGAQLSLEQARRRNAFEMSLAADAGFAGTDLTHAVPPDMRLTDPNATFSDRLRRDLGASVALQFRRPLFDPMAGPSIQAREASLRAAELRAGTALLERRREVLDLLGHWRAAAERLRLTRGALVRADEHLIRLRSLYAGGGATLLEVLDARRQLDDARTRLAEARAATDVARWEGELRR
jgi:outer membrane protein TolC